MSYTYEQLSPLGKWITVTTDEPPLVVNGRVKKAEGQGPKVRGVRQLSDNDDKNLNT